MSTQVPPSAPQPADDSKVTSLAWAVATIVVALVVGLIAWLALRPDTGDDAGTASQPAASSNETTAAEDPMEGLPDPALQTTPPDVATMMLDLQRREADDPVAVGDVDAPVVMIEYSDYRCPYCAKFALEIAPELQDLVDDGTLRIEHRDFVIFDEPSRLAAVAVRAAAEQGKAQEMRDAVFALSRGGHGDVTEEIVVDLAEKAGVKDMEAFTKALGSTEIGQAVDSDTEEARTLGLQSTPTFLVNTQLVQGAYPAEYVRRVVEVEAERAQD